MNPRELLESAAMAGGIGPVRGFDHGDPGSRDMAVLVDSGKRAPLRWNSRANDSDAFQLLCKLSLRIVEDRGGAYRAVQYTLNPEADDESIHEIEIEWPHTPAATRDAITRAAAEIGRKD